MIAALIRRVRHRKARRQVRWAHDYVSGRYGSIAQRRALENREARKP